MNRKELDQEFVTAFVESLPDPEGARAFLRRIQQNEIFDHLRSQPLLLSRVLTIASYSPMLGETILRHPEYVLWLQREAGRDLPLLKSTERLSQDLARFVIGTISTDRRTSLVRFKRRELLRIYLRDCLGLATLSETTDELSNLADSILADALAQAYQEMVNQHGAPLERDERGRIVTAEMVIVSLGKLGCRELNYASDIDLFFLYSTPGQTAGDGRAASSVITNKEFFTKVAERIVQMIGNNSGEGAVYRIDLRLRPYGRDGDLVWDTARASEYYRETAENWERQSLIRARDSAGSHRVASAFLESVRDVIFSTDVREDAINAVRRVREKIERKTSTRGGGFNVKLGRGGIREIEFIAQALQLQHGGREPWVRSTQTLIVLARLAEKGFLSDAERATLSSAYNFLRMVEHRLQMEHGAQTHTLPTGSERLNLLARRCGYLSGDAAREFLADLDTHTAAVRAVYQRVFERRDEVTTPEPPPQVIGADEESERLLQAAVNAISRLAGHISHASIESVARQALDRALNRLRSLKNLIGWVESAETHRETVWGELGPERLAGLIERLTIVLSSQYLAQILIPRPRLGEALLGAPAFHSCEEYLQVLRQASHGGETTSARADALRRAWYEQIIGIGYRDMMSVVEIDSPDLSEAERMAARAEAIMNSNRAQTSLAEAALRRAVEIALGACGVDDGSASLLRFSVLGLGRLGHAGMDYGSDLDLMVVYDDESSWPPVELDRSLLGDGVLSASEFYSKFTSQLVNVLGLITREGMIYRVDLRLRPEGKSGPLARGLGSLLGYIESRASAWEHSAYLKARKIAGDRGFGDEVQRRICEASFDAASRNPTLKEHLREMRLRIEREKVRGTRPDLKWGAGGVTDAYFITRYLQLAHHIYFPPERGTAALISHLSERGVIDSGQAVQLLEGYRFLRSVDHWLRLLLERPTSVLPSSPATLESLARAIGLSSGNHVEEMLAGHCAAMRRVFDEVLSSES
ncbi:MAG TPA: hypothetical protein VKM94_10085 [Blastocatellia bacterium]|nr:hypothetical protein [Blastocatellia bacterium]